MAKSIKTYSLIMTAMLTASVGHAQEQTQYSATVKMEHPTQVFWGDTHLHTERSQDAYAFGVRLDPDAAYRFAKGEEIVASHGQPAKLKRPLDFLVIADHAEGLGAMVEVKKGHPTLLQSERLKRWHDLLNSGDPRGGLIISQDTRENGMPPELGLKEIIQPAWLENIKEADKHNRPGQFTAFHGFEWTSMEGGSNLHRVVVFRDGSDKTKQVIPFSSNVDPDPEGLWEYMLDYQDKTGGKVLAIPHNPNLSNGLMFQSVRYDGTPINKAYAQRRAALEPIVEVTQIKGDSEAHPLLSPNDEFADFGTWDWGNFAGVPKTPEMLPGDYARSGLKLGLQLEEQVGANPFKFGMIGSTDSHTALATPEEDNFYGKHSAGQEPSAKRRTSLVGKAADVSILGWEQVAGSYAAVWAQDNTREAIWDAMQRKETYATTGTRISLRVFAGWDFTADDTWRSDYVSHGYQHGVPMGGDLANGSEQKAPKLLIRATKDPIGANLDRVQVVKGWLNNNGETEEKVYDVVWSNSKERKITDDKLSPVGNTVNIDNATYSNSIGDAELGIVWQDPDFNPSERAFYYVRVLEIPTPHWTLIDARRFGTELTEQAPQTIQERAYSSPIWYTPTR